jgi:N-acyl-D-aspartate/D-glutamate deacylase
MGDAANAHWVGRSVSEQAEAEGADPLDCFLDMALAEDLATQFVIGMPPSETFDQIIATLIRDPIVMAGSSDAGAPCCRSSAPITSPACRASGC